MSKKIIQVLLLMLISCKQNNQEETQANQNLDTANSTKTILESEAHKDQKDSISCKESSHEMESETICIIKNSTIEKAYHNLILYQEVDASESLLKEFPKNNKTVEITEKNLSINYKTSKSKLEIEMNFAGGVTIISLKQIGNNIERTIRLSAD